MRYLVLMYMVHHGAEGCNAGACTDQEQVMIQFRGQYKNALRTSYQQLRTHLYFVEQVGASRTSKILEPSGEEAME